MSSEPSEPIEPAPVTEVIPSHAVTRTVHLPAVATSGEAQALMARWAIPLRLNAKYTFSDLITPVSCEAGINLWNGLANHRRNTTHLMDWPRAVEDMRHG